MQIKTVQQLNGINTDFYNSIAQEFSDSRNYFWQGWDEILPHLKNPTKNVLDVGCGNGRFADFLIKKNFSDFFYSGIDNNESLLTIAKNQILSTRIAAEFLKIDIITELINRAFNKKVPNKKFDLIVVFGVMHHIPSYKLRLQLLQELTDLLSENGILVTTFWQFKNNERFLFKQINPEKVGIDQNDLEENDFILDWQRGKEAFRYFHHTDESEQNKLAQNLKNAELISEFYADGKTQKLNKYLIFKKISSPVTQ